MISATLIRELAEKKIQETETNRNKSFLVDVSVSAMNKIRVTIDNIDGLAINECVNMSRFIENQLDRETEVRRHAVGPARVGGGLVLAVEGRIDLDGVEDRRVAGQVAAFRRKGGGVLR